MAARAESRRLAAARLARALRSYGLRDLPMPAVRGEKRPKLHHAGGQYDEHTARSVFVHGYGCVDAEECDLGLLLRDMIVLDFDDVALFERMRAEGLLPADGHAPLQRTKKGFHVFFRRTPVADELKLFDGARQCRDEVGAELLLDIKTVNAPSKSDGSQTSGFLMVEPSEGKRWVVALWERAPPPLPDALARWLADARARFDAARGSGRGGARACAQREDGGAAPRARPETQKDVAALLELLRFPVSAHPEVRRGEPDAAHVLELLTFKPSAGKACHICGKVHDNDLIGCVWRDDDGGYRMRVRHRNRATVNPRCKRMYGVDAEAAAAHRQALEQRPRASVAAASRVAAALAAAAPAFASGAAVWQLAAPQDGFSLHAARGGGGGARDAHYFLFLEDGAGAAWSRRSELPALAYEARTPRALWTQLAGARDALGLDCWVAAGGAGV